MTNQAGLKFFFALLAAGLIGLGVVALILSWVLLFARG